MIGNRLSFGCILHTHVTHIGALHILRSYNISASVTKYVSIEIVAEHVVKYLQTIKQLLRMTKFNWAGGRNQCFAK